MVEEKPNVVEEKMTLKNFEKTEHSESHNLPSKPILNPPKGFPLLTQC